MPVSEILGSGNIQQLISSKMQEECHFPAEVMKASYPLHSDPGIGCRGSQDDNRLRQKADFLFLSPVFFIIIKVTKIHYYKKQAIDYF